MYVGRRLVGQCVLHEVVRWAEDDDFGKRCLQVVAVSASSSLQVGGTRLQSLGSIAVAGGAGGSVGVDVEHLLVSLGLKSSHARHQCQTEEGGLLLGGLHQGDVAAVEIDACHIHHVIGCSLGVGHREVRAGQHHQAGVEVDGGGNLWQSLHQSGSR